MPDLLSTREAARIELAHGAVRSEGALGRAFERALRLAASVLGVRRAGFWFVETEFDRMRAALVFDAETDSFDSGEIIHLTTCPAYAAAIRSRRTLVVENAATDSNTLELRDYLSRHGIASVVDSPVFQGGDLIGVLCLEHVGTPRAFSKEDSNFSASVADMLGLYLEQDHLQRTYRELLEARQALEQARIMESLGRMAAGVAHDFNNLLGAMVLKNDLLQAQPATPAARALTDDIGGLLDQGARLVRQLLMFARREADQGSVVDLAEICEAMVPTLRSMVGADIELSFEQEGGALPVHIERSRLEQVLMNLVVNARDAMLGGGRLRLALSRDAAADQAVLRVSDTGVGMDEVTQARMFEPFFTTKSQGRGTGLGLATVHGIVHDSQGTIEVDSAIGEGTRVTVRWPLART